MTRNEALAYLDQCINDARRRLVTDLLCDEAVDADMLDAATDTADQWTDAQHRAMRHIIERVVAGLVDDDRPR